MYVYKVIHIPTGKFYLGLSNKNKSSFDPTRDLDPYNQFEITGSNGSRLKMVNVEKRIIALAGDVEELATIGASLAKSMQDDPNFLGLQGQPKNDNVKDVKENPPTVSKPASSLSTAAPKASS